MVREILRFAVKRLTQDDEHTGVCGTKAGLLGVVGGLRDVEDVVPYAKKKASIVGEAICLPQNDEEGRG